MLKYTGDILEKMTVGALCVGIFQEDWKGVILGATGLAVWILLRLKETRNRNEAS